MRALTMGLAVLGPLLAMTAMPLPARAESCDDLWYARNEIYKAQGYCFRTRRGIDAFGNAGCRYDNADEVPLSAAQRRTIADIQREERARRCPR
ncbi:YARHG domain-containing protein [Bosea sp. (in: a-proteobacteria)]|uniref:YARHG domain-containing protein n=1 Tax=Bosea sp. (in: a-proteobacteria) TaxID=1871050 RepID=UPI0025BDD6DC|nr:YARHG domain-containing protein [Bosea sp. (in: a-proteobacteria)]